MFCGDFNAIRSRRERKSSSGKGDTSSGHTPEINGFNGFIESNLLLDLSIVGKKYTWFKANGSAKSRLDKVLVSEEWMKIWPMCKQYVQRREGMQCILHSSGTIPKGYSIPKGCNASFIALVPKVKDYIQSHCKGAGW